MNVITQNSMSLSHLNLILSEKHDWSTLLGIRNGKAEQIILFTDNELASKEAIRLTNSGYNVFFCPNTMKVKPVTGRGSKEDITTQYAIVVDIDIEGCDKHKSTNDKKYAPSIEVALSFLTKEPSLIIHTGYGLQVYYILSQPRPTDKLSKKVTRLFIKEIQNKAKELGYVGVDSTFSLNNLFRLPGTKNYKLVGKKLPKELPICRVIKSSNIKYNFDELVDSLINNLVEPDTSVTTPATAAKRQPKSSKSAEADLAWGIYFFKRIAAERLSYEQWRNAIWIGHAVGVDLSTLDRWSSLDSARYAGTASIEKLISEYQDHGLGIGTLINYLKELEPNDPFTIPFTYEGYSIQLHYFYGNTLKYIRDIKQWTLYENGVWNFYESALPDLAKIPICMTRSLKALSTFTDNKIIKFINAWTDSVVFEKSLKIYGGLHMIQSTEFNSHRHLLNVANGVIDLRTGALLPHDPKYYFTYKLDVPYYPLADIMSNSVGTADLNNPVSSTTTQISDIALGDIYNGLLQIQAFFESIIPDYNNRIALLRFLGYCITGDIKAQKALFIYGPGGNGKSVLLNLLKTLLDKLAVFSDSGLLTENSYSLGKPTTKLVPLKNTRLVIIPEQDQSSQINSSQFKLLVGENYLKIRHMFEEEQIIPIYFKLILSGNYQIDLTDANDIGVQRRIFQLNFSQDFRKIGNPNILDILTTPSSLTALLSLLVEEAKEYYKTGLLESEEMQSAKADYIKSNDFISEFIDEFCIRKDKVRCKTFIEQLIEQYPQNCKTHSYRSLFKMIQNVPGITKITVDGYTYFKGISFK